MGQEEEIYREMKWEDSGVWFISDEYGFKVAIKLPSHIVRSIMKGCRFDFLFGKDQTSKENIFFHSALRVYDNETNPFVISQPNRFLREYVGLAKILNEKKVIVEFYDETVTCSATAEMTISESDRVKILDLMGDINKLYVGGFSEALSLSLDSFDYSVDQLRATSKTYVIETRSIHCQIANIRVIVRSFVGLNEVNDVEFSEKDEGGTFEKQVWCSLESLFNYDIYLNPKVLQGEHTRELTDILAFHSLGIFLIETKALGVLNLSKEQSIERKVANVKKQVLKGVKQLVGANNCLSNNWEITSQDGRSIKVIQNIIPHGIILVSELIPFGDWSEVQKEIMLAMINNKIFLHVIDFLEFMKFIKASNGRKEFLDYYLMERSEKFIQSQGNIFIKANFVQSSKS